jgi:hypothetical protein
VRNRTGSIRRKTVHSEWPARLGNRHGRTGLVGRQVGRLQTGDQLASGAGQGNRTDENRPEGEAEVAQEVGGRACHARQVQRHRVQCRRGHGVEGQCEADSDEQGGEENRREVQVEDVQPGGRERSKRHEQETRRQQPARGDVLQHAADLAYKPDGAEWMGGGTLFFWAFWLAWGALRRRLSRPHLARAHAP